MSHNVFYPVTAMPVGAVKSPGVCSIKYFRHEDVLAWPTVDPQTGIINSTVQLKPGAYMYLCESINPSRSFSENGNKGSAGYYEEQTIKGSLSGSSAAQLMALNTMVHHQWVLIVADKNGVTRLIGDKDSGAEFVKDYTSGQGSDSRKTELTWKWQYPGMAPIYSASCFDIVIGGEIITAGCLRLVIRFRVGDPGAPMVDGDTLLINSGFVNKTVLVLADGMKLPVDDFSGDIDWTGSIQRRVEKAPASNTINFIGGVRDEEIIEIYAYSL